MKLISKLEDILKPELKWDKRRIKSLIQMLLSIMVVRTVNLAVISNQIASGRDHVYRRLQRFFSDCEINYDQIAKLIYRLFGFGNRQIYILLDRTNWKWGKKSINILFLSVVYLGISIPVYWVILNKGGNSSTRERKALVRRFIKVFGQENIAGLLADREFIGKDWFNWLIKEKIPFFIRIRNDADTTNKSNLSVEVGWLFYHLKAREKMLLTDRKKIYGQWLFVSAGRAPNNELMIIVSNSRVENMIETYLLRWQIESMFQCLKGRGFNFEDTHITARHKIKKLIALLAIGFCWAHLVGEWRHNYMRRIKLKKHGRKEISFFRYGLNLIHNALAEIIISVKPIKKLIMLLKPHDYWIKTNKSYTVSEVF